MKKYFKHGIALLLPIALVSWIVWWIYDKANQLVFIFAPQSWGSEWWYPLVAIVGVVFSILLIGLIFSFIKPLSWLLHKTEKWIINQIPVINKIYGFGKEVADGFISDVKNDGEMEVVEVMFAGQPSLGLLTDKENGIVFVATCPNPLNGFIVRTTDYTNVDMTPVEYFKILGSLGKVGGNKWKKEKEKP